MGNGLGDGDLELPSRMGTDEDVLDDEEREEFVAAGLGCLDTAAAMLERLRAGSGIEEVREELHRSLHTLKGVAGFLRCDPLYVVSLRAETALKRVGAGALRFEPSHAPLLERALGLLRRRILDDPCGTDFTSEETAVVEELEAWLAQEIALGSREE